MGRELERKNSRRKRKNEKKETKSNEHKDGLKRNCESTNHTNK
jgi:hypothetical protein